MKKIFAFTLTLFFTIPTYSMLMKPLKPSQLQKRCYATMAQKDFNKLVDDPLSLHTFVSELSTMKKDAEDLNDLRIKLALKVWHFEERSEHPTPRVDIGCLSITVPAMMVGMEQMTKAISQLITDYSVHSSGLLAVPVVVICGGITLDCVSDLKKFVVLKNKLNLYKKKLTHVEWLSGKAALEKHGKE